MLSSIGKARASSCAATGVVRKNLDRLSRPLAVLSVGALAAAACAAPPAPSAGLPPVASSIGVEWVRVLSRYPHAAECRTSGLLVRQGLLYEICEPDEKGAHGAIVARPLRDETASPRTSPIGHASPTGMAIVGDKIYQLAQRDKIVVRSLDSLAEVGQLPLCPVKKPGDSCEGWGLAFDGTLLIRSDRTSKLSLHDPNTLDGKGALEVKLEGRDVGPLDQLEYVDGRIYASVFNSAYLYSIDPRTGDVTSIVDLTNLAAAVPGPLEPMVSGLTYDPKSGHLFLIGKHWPSMFEVELLPRSEERASAKKAFAPRALGSELDRFPMDRLLTELQARVAVMPEERASGLLTGQKKSMGGASRARAPDAPMTPILDGEAGKRLVPEEVFSVYTDDPIVENIIKRQKAIYLGDYKKSDSRKDMYQVNDPKLRALAESVAAMVLSERVTEDGTSHRLRGSTFTNVIKEIYSLPLCPNEPFRMQPSIAFCSASLVSKDVVLTAGHCFDGVKYRADNVRFVFGYQKAQDKVVNTLIPPSDVYQAVKVLKKGDQTDWALIQIRRLDGKPSAPRPTLPVRDYLGDRILDGASVLTMGYPVGLPLKLADSARVTANQDPSVFKATLDTFGGNSGSPVFNAKLEIVGILIEGEPDFAPYPSNDCTISQVYPTTGEQGEVCVRSSEFAKYIPTGRP